MRLSRERFEELTFEIAEAVLDELPPDLRAEAETVVLEIADQATPEQTQGRGALLGLYEGVPLVERHADSTLLQPDRITLFREPLQALARTEVELRRQIRKTLIHELGHFFGFDEDELHARGWG
ncbi:MAG TPA: metallopeptidase family protein [Anaerolineales bacterium]|nr:metallopeptidase family protein [Anaerolineales bacterium]